MTTKKKKIGKTHNPETVGLLERIKEKVGVNKDTELIKYLNDEYPDLGIGVHDINSFKRHNPSKLMRFFIEEFIKK